MIKASDIDIAIITSRPERLSELADALEAKGIDVSFFSGNLGLAVKKECLERQLVMVDVERADAEDFSLVRRLAALGEASQVPLIALVSPSLTKSQAEELIGLGAHDFLALEPGLPGLSQKIAIHLNYRRELLVYKRRVAELEAKVVEISEELGKSLRKLESLGAIIDTVVAHDSLVEDQMDVELKAAQYQADHDPLTQIYNRLSFNKSLEHEFSKARQAGTRLALIMADIDHFKEINDSYGHDAGDRVLIAIARTVRMLLPDSCLFARWGGEEFMVLAPGFALGQAFDLAEFLRLSIEKSVMCDGVRRVTCSFGVTELLPGIDPDGLVKGADSALYEAKSCGRNRVCPHSTEVVNE
jgi:diguanylate cyclase (GGDEF)-like protein